jgi:hypothetical protein
MSVATDNNAASGTTVPAPAARPGSQPGEPDAVERALAAAIQDATRIADLLDTLRSARLWLPLPADRRRHGAVGAGAVTLPTVVYLGCEFIPAYTSAELLTGLARPAGLAGLEPPGPEPAGLEPAGPEPAGPEPAGLPGPDRDRQLPGHDGALVPHIVVRAVDLARLMPADVGIALNVGASQSVPVYPQGVAFLAADEPADARRVTVGPLPVQPEQLLAAIRAGLALVPQARRASAGWLSVQFAGEGMIVSVTLDDPANAAARQLVIDALERAACSAGPDAGYPIDVTFPGEGAPDHIDHWMATATQPFYVRD